MIPFVIMLVAGYGLMQKVDKLDAFMKKLFTVEDLGETGEYVWLCGRLFVILGV